MWEGGSFVVIACSCGAHSCDSLMWEGLFHCAHDPSGRGSADYALWDIFSGISASKKLPVPQHYFAVLLTAAMVLLQ